MKVGSVGSHLYLVGTQPRGRTSKPTRKTEQSMAWVDQVAQIARVARLAVLPPVGGVLDGAQKSTPGKYSAQVEGLRTRIQGGLYGVNSFALARCILVNETHFLQMHPE